MARTMGGTSGLGIFEIPSLAFRQNSSDIIGTAGSVAVGFDLKQHRMGLDGMVFFCRVSVLSRGTGEYRARRYRGEYATAVASSGAR